MSSSRSSTPLDLEAGLATKPEDVRALRFNRRPRPMTLEQFLTFLKQFPPTPAAVLRARRGPRGPRPFEL